MAKSKFISSANVPKRRFFSSSGTKYQPEYLESVDDFGQPCLLQSGLVDLDQLHNADRDSCDLKLIIKRYQQGDIQALQQRADAFYGDITSMPQDAIEAARRALAGRQMFDALPLVVKRQFGNDPVVWLDALSKGDKFAMESIGVKYVERNVDIEAPKKKRSTKKAVETPPPVVRDEVISDE